MFGESGWCELWLGSPSGMLFWSACFPFGPPCGPSRRVLRPLPGCLAVCVVFLGRPCLGC